MVKNFNIDRCRVSVTGASMGAYAALELAKRWPGSFAAVRSHRATYKIVKDYIRDIGICIYIYPLMSG